VTAVRRTLAAAALLGLWSAFVTTAPAAAEFGPIRLVSKTAVQQADVAVAPAISADGRYLAFQGTLGTAAGVFREDLQSGAIVPVAVTDGSGGGGGTAPSISADGRYVSFTTRAQLDPDDDVGAQTSDVYLADMATSPPTYELASALDGCDPAESSPHTPCGLTYSGTGEGSEATGRVALSADGRKVVFVTSAESDLTSGPGDSTEGVATPARQVVLRDLGSDTTTLVSVERDSPSGTMTGRPVAGGALVSKGLLAPLRGAALSADGTTVAWIGANLPAQVPLSTAEAETIEQLDAGSFPYDEPLWRRVADGPSAPTRRIVAGDGAAGPFPHLAEKSTSFNLAEGWLGVEHVDGVPQLSANGRIVAMIGNPAEATDVFVADMAAGLSRAQAVHPLTHEVVVNPGEPSSKVNESGFLPLNGHIFDLAISGDGRRIAFTTVRQRSLLTPPNPIGSPPLTVGLAELYVIDRERETVERVTHGVAGVGEASLDREAVKIPEGSNVRQGDGASSPSFGPSGLIAFGSTAFNLVPGDGNEQSDAFVVEELEGQHVPGASAISPPPPRRQRRRWRLTLSSNSLPDGSVRLVAGVPAAGRLRALVGPEPGGRVRARRLVAVRAHALKEGRIGIELKLPRRLGHLAHTSEGVYAMARVSFHHRGRRALRGRVQIRFHAHRERREGR
jgi:hypothetical protein